MLLRESSEVQLIKGLFFTHTSHLFKFSDSYCMINLKKKCFYLAAAHHFIKNILSLKQDSNPVLFIVLNTSL